MRSRYFFIVVMLHLIILKVNGQGSSYPISSNHIELLRFQKDIPRIGAAVDIVQGPNGHIWISGYGGLVRYNGSAFKVFNLENTDILTSEKFELLATDSKTKVFASSPSGIYSFSLKGVEKLKGTDRLPLISSMVADTTGSLWIVNNKKLLYYKDSVLTPYELPDASVQNVIELSDRSIWAIGNKGFYKLSFDKYDSYSVESDQMNVYEGGGIDKNGSPFFISGHQKALILKDEQFVEAPWNNMLNGVLIKGVQQDKNGSVWISGQGIASTDFEEFMSYDFSKIRFDNQTFRFCIDRENTKWVIGKEGIWVVQDPGSKSIYLKGEGEARFSKLTSGIVSLGDSSVLVGTNGQGLRYLRKFSLDYPKYRNTVGDVIYGLTKDAKGFIASSNNGTFRFDFNGKEIINQEPLITEISYLYLKDQEGTEFFHILKLDGKESVLYKKDGKFQTLNELEDLKVFQMIETENYGLIFCTEKGVFSLDEDRLSNLNKEMNLAIDECYTAWEDPITGSLLIGTAGSGLTRISREGVKSYTTKGGFPSNTIKSIYPLNDQELVLASISELFVFSKNDLLSDDSEKHGLNNYMAYDLHQQVNAVGGPNMIILNQKVLVNTSTGISEVDLSRKQSSFINLLVESVQTNDSTFVAPSKVALKADDNEVTFHFSTIRYTDTRYSSFSYKLEGIEDSWKSADGLSSVNYPQLPPGSFIFRLREQRTDGTYVYSDPVYVEKAKPWYLSFWIIVVYGLIGLILIGRIVAFRTRMIKRQNQRLQAEVDRQTIELQKSVERTEETVVQRTKELREAYTLLQEGEERLSRAFEISKDGIWDWNLDNDKIAISNAVYTMLGYEPFEFPAKLKEILKRVHPSDKNKEELMFVLHPETIPENGFDTEIRLAHKDKKYIWVRIKVNAYGRRDGTGPKRMVGVITDITSEKIKKQQILEAIVRTENIERSRISRDIHDGLQQTLTVSQMNLLQLKKFLNGLPKSALETYETCKDYLTRSINESRNVAHTLMPRSISDLGLVHSIENLVESMNQSSSSIKFNFRQNLENKKIQSEEVIITMYRVLQEALNNVVKYAEASEVNIQLIKHEDLLTMTIEDNGKGFDMRSLEKESFGIKSMSNRLDAIDGFLEIDSRIGTGTFVIAEVNNVFEIN